MPSDFLFAMVAFAFGMAMTPGPNNIMLAASGVNFGFQRSIPMMSGVSIGFLVLMTACAAGLGIVFTSVPMLQLGLKVAGAAYMLYLAWKVASAQPANGEGADLGSPWTFLQAAAFQWVIPRACARAPAAAGEHPQPVRSTSDQKDLAALRGNQFGRLRHVLRNDRNRIDPILICLFE